MSDSEVEADIRRDTVWHRPSWPLSGKVWSDARFRGIAPEEVLEELDGLKGPERNRKSNGNGGHPGVDEGVRRAVAVFGVEPPLSAASVKSRYKVLVKRHHPDANNGDKASEEKIKQINDAYQTLMDFLAP